LRSAFSACSARLSNCFRSCSKRAFVTGLFAAATFIAHLCANCRRCSDRTLMSCPISGKQWHAQSHSISQPTCSRAHPRCDDRALGAHARLAGIWVAAAWFSKIRPLRLSFVWPRYCLGAGNTAALFSLIELAPLQRGFLLITIFSRAARSS
jgi:hypothetical protein